MLSRPAADEFGGHFGTYINLVADRSVLEQLEDNRRNATALFAKLTDEEANFRYAPDKWSLKEVLGHLADTERVMSYRMLRIARGDTTPLPGFDQDSYISNADFTASTVERLLADYEAVRASTVSLIRSIPAEAWTRKGTASNTEMSARAFAYVIAGHELHHLSIVRDRYLSA
ncbi:DinB family protein [Paenibacillus rhizovicinus]|uniref:DinB family protein n=1 Tax=Paenibacillus rhizovicinus TaxID=2704463 RepID=A0A6C0NYM1_9BACL|nr:DinB family protein [Paenibacillus rhizovicinus]QHW31317.1 DinB family protein [Paenibacillus rhizovicinus]